MSERKIEPLSTQRRHEIAYLYMKYGMRYQSPLQINHPVYETTMINWGLRTTVLGPKISCDPYQMVPIVELIQADLKADKIDTLPEKDPNVKDWGEIVYNFIVAILVTSEFNLNEALRNHLIRFCDTVNVSKEEGVSFFNGVFSYVMEIKLKHVFSENVWFGRGVMKA